MNIWLDDIRSAPDGYIWVKNWAEFYMVFSSATHPIQHISFDNDLGEHEIEGRKIAHWVFSQVRQGVPKPVRLSCHSMNPIAAKEINATIKDIANWQQ